KSTPAWPIPRADRHPTRQSSLRSVTATSRGTHPVQRVDEIHVMADPFGAPRSVTSLFDLVRDGSIHWPIDFSAVLAAVNAVGSTKKSTIAAAELWSSAPNATPISTLSSTNSAKPITLDVLMSEPISPPNI